MSWRQSARPVNESTWVPSPPAGSVGVENLVLWTWSNLTSVANGGTTTPLTWGTPNYDPESMVSGSTITIPSSGVYKLTTYAFWYPAGGSVRRAALLLNDDVSVMPGQAYDAVKVVWSAVLTFQHVNCALRLATGDELAVGGGDDAGNLYQDSGGAINMYYVLQMYRVSGL